MSKFVRLEQTLARTLSGLIAQLQDPRIPIIVTVERVKVSPDGRQARILVSALGSEEEAEMLTALNGAAGHLQAEIAHELALRFTPRLHFFADPGEVL